MTNSSEVSNILNWSLVKELIKYLSSTNDVIHTDGGFYFSVEMKDMLIGGLEHNNYLLNKEYKTQITKDKGLREDVRM